MISGSIQLSFSPVVNVMPLSHDGKQPALAASTGKLAASMPDPPTVAEAGVPGYSLDLWYGMLAPAKTPKASLNALSTEVAKFRKIVRKAGIQPE